MRRPAAGVRRRPGPADLIGEPEAAALVVQRQGMKPPRPMGPDLTVALLGAVDAHVERVVVERLRNNTFFATVTVTSAGEPHEVDARPSDALNLAVRSQAPIRVATDVIESAGITDWPDTVESNPAIPQWTPLTPGHARSRVAPHKVGEDSPEILRLAAQEARRLGHRWIGSAHLMLGILAHEESAAARLLVRHGVTRAAARAAVAAMFVDQPAVPPPAAGAFLTPHATIAMALARRHGTDEADPAHLLLALIDNSGPVTLLNTGDVDLLALRGQLIAELGA